MNCKRCGMTVTWDEGRCLNANTGAPHSSLHCRTKIGHVWCPECRHAFPKNGVCEHYRKYNYKPDHAENFYIKLILEKYEPGSWVSRRNNWKDRPKKPQICPKCNLDKNKMSYSRRQRHEQECKNQERLT